MSIRVGAMLVVSGLALTLVLGPVFVIVGLLVAVCGGIVAAVGMEASLTHQTPEPTARTEAADHERSDVAEDARPIGA